MKSIIIILLLGISLSYNPTAAISYAHRYCNKYNPKYKNYKNSGCDCANFVSQCMTAGGLDLSECSGKDEKGMIPVIANLKTCLTQKKWKHSSSRPAIFKAGYPIFMKVNSHAMLATGFSDGNIIYCSHGGDRCDGKIMASSVEYYYL